MRISDWSSDVCSSDLVLTAENADALLKRMHRLDPETAYMLHRVEADTGLPTVNSNGQPKPHPNSFVMTRDMYWRLGGYDEWFTGIYGTDSIDRKSTRLNSSP